MFVFVVKKLTKRNSIKFYGRVHSGQEVRAKNLSNRTKFWKDMSWPAFAGPG